MSSKIGFDQFMHPRAGTVPAVPEQPAGLDVQLEQVTERALRKAHEILDERFDATNGVLARAQTAVIATALSTQARTDETRLRSQRVDMLPKLIELMEQEAKKLPPLVHDPSHRG
jgi:hypothetical protein